MMRVARPTGLLPYLGTKQPPNRTAHHDAFDGPHHIRLGSKQVVIELEARDNKDVAKADDVAEGFEGGEFGEHEGPVSVKYWLRFIVDLLVRSEQL